MGENIGEFGKLVYNHQSFFTQKSYPYPSNPKESWIRQSFILQAIQRAQFPNIFTRQRFLLYGSMDDILFSVVVK